MCLVSSVSLLIYLGSNSLSYSSFIIGGSDGYLDRALRQNRHPIDSNLRAIRSLKSSFPSINVKRSLVTSIVWSENLLKQRVRQPVQKGHCVKGYWQHRRQIPCLNYRSRSSSLSLGLCYTLSWSLILCYGSLFLGIVRRFLSKFPLNTDHQREQ